MNPSKNHRILKKANNIQQLWISKKNSLRHSQAFSPQAPMMSNTSYFSLREKSPIQSKLPAKKLSYQDFLNQQQNCIIPRKKMKLTKPNLIISYDDKIRPIHNGRNKIRLSFDKFKMPTNSKDTLYSNVKSTRYSMSDWYQNKNKCVQVQRKQQNMIKPNKKMSKLKMRPSIIKKQQQTERKSWQKIEVDFQRNFSCRPWTKRGQNQQTYNPQTSHSRQYL